MRETEEVLVHSEAEGAVAVGDADRNTTIGERQPADREGEPERGPRRRIRAGRRVGGYAIDRSGIERVRARERRPERGLDRERILGIKRRDLDDCARVREGHRGGVCGDAPERARQRDNREEPFHRSLRENRPRGHSPNRPAASIRFVRMSARWQHPCRGRAEVNDRENVGRTSRAW